MPYDIDTAVAFRISGGIDADLRRELVLDGKLAAVLAGNFLRGDAAGRSCLKRARRVNAQRAFTPRSCNLEF